MQNEPRTNEPRTIIISNRLPVKLVKKNDIYDYQPSEGGLATGLGSIYKKNNNFWIGWPGAVVEKGVEQQIEDGLAGRNLVPVFLTEQEVNDYYEGFSNGTLWPLFHYFPSYSVLNPQYWESYKKVNQKFADAIIARASKDDVVWIHDYQLMLVPDMVRKVLPEISIGFFNHIPFPSYEIFRVLPWSKELISGLLGADVIGFHTYDDVRHFISAAGRIAGVPANANELFVGDRYVTVDAFPISIDYQKYNELAENASTIRNVKNIRKLVGDSKLVISIDRLDYSKGIIQRLQAYDLLMEKHPELRGKVTYIQLVVPSRDTVSKYKELKEEMSRLVGEINGKYGRLSWQPVLHFYRSFPPELLSALYHTADVALVTPMRDGMNLVSKEYVASCTDLKGVLVLSEMAGASRELSEALMVNPNDIWCFADVIYEALNMPADEQKRRMLAMRQTVARFDINTWVNNFMDKMKEVKSQQQRLYVKKVSPSIRQKISIRYHYAQKRLILLDYDGTLVPYQQKIEEAKPDSQLLQTLTLLAADVKNHVVITSGRNYKTLFNWLGHLDIDLVAEHGAWYKQQGKDWEERKDLNDGWKQEIIHIINTYVNRTPGAYAEEKSHSLAWHYRKVEEGLGDLRAHELEEDIQHFLSDRGLQMLRGDKVLEIKNLSVSKGKAAANIVHANQYDFVMAIGDDHTDEDTFLAVPDDAITIKVGSNISVADYYMNSYVDVRTLLNELSDVKLPFKDLSDVQSENG